MARIEPAAHLDLCSCCGKHGFIRLPNERISFPFISKSSARALVERGFNAGLLDEAECEFLMLQINRAANLAETYDETSVSAILWLQVTGEIFERHLGSEDFRLFEEEGFTRKSLREIAMDDPCGLGLSSDGPKETLH